MAANVETMFSVREKPWHGLGTVAVKVALTPIRVVCNNTLNLALRTAKRSWSMLHTGDVREKISEARDTLLWAENYMDSLGKEIDTLRKIKLSDREVREYMDMLLSMDDGISAQQKKNIMRLREDMQARYFDAPDLQDVGKNAYRFINAVSDFATHAQPVRKTANYRENLFLKTVEGNPLIDRAYHMVAA